MFETVIFSLTKNNMLFEISILQRGYLQYCLQFLEQVKAQEHIGRIWRLSIETVLFLVKMPRSSSEVWVGMH